MAHPRDDNVDGYFDVTTERTPLISSTPNEGANQPSRGRPVLHVRGASLASITSTIAVPQAHEPGTIVAIVCAIVFFAAGSGALQQMAATRVFEDIYCRQYYAGRTELLAKPIDESMCKEDKIQSQLAYFFAVSMAVDAIVNCLAALPWGAAADRIGRKMVLSIALLGFTLQIGWTMIVGWFSNVFPPHFYWFSSLFLIVGGGNAAVNACIGSMVSDMLPELERSIAFMRIHIASTVGNLVAPAVASIIMSVWGPWPVLFTSFFLMALSMVAIMFVPETMHRKPERREDADLTLRERLAKLGEQAKSMFAILKNPSICIVLIVVCLSIAYAISTYQFLVQYASKRYHIPIAETGYIQTAYGIGQMMVVLFLFPWVTKWVLKPTTPRIFRIENKHKRDLALSRVSYIIILVGSFVMAISPRLTGFVIGLIIMSLGAGGDSMVKSTASALVEPDQTSRLFTLMGIAGIGGSLWISPALAALFSSGMHLGGGWIGLPYFGVTACMLLMFTLMMFVRTPIGREEQGDEESSGEESSSAEDDE